MQGGAPPCYGPARHLNVIDSPTEPDRSYGGDKTEQPGRVDAPTPLEAEGDVARMGGVEPEDRDGNQWDGRQERRRHPRASHLIDRSTRHRHGQENEPRHDGSPNPADTSGEIGSR